MLNRVGYGKGIVVFEREPRVQIGKAYTRPYEHPDMDDQMWVQQVLFSKFRGEFFMDMDNIVALLFFVGILIVFAGG